MTVKVNAIASDITLAIHNGVTYSIKMSISSAITRKIKSMISAGKKWEEISSLGKNQSYCGVIYKCYLSVIIYRYDIMSFRW
jgi:hypothetical protein